MIIYGLVLNSEGLEFGPAEANDPKEKTTELCGEVS